MAKDIPTVRIEITNLGGSEQRVVVDGVDLGHVIEHINVQHRGSAHPIVDIRFAHAEVIEHLDAQARAVVERLVEAGKDPDA
jgi:hypothetical protein